MRRLPGIVALLLLLGSLWLIYDSASAYVGTGTLRVVASDPKAVISISRLDMNAAVIGVGKASIRIKPGAYQLVANDGGILAHTTATVAKHQTTNAQLNIDTTLNSPAVVGLFNYLPVSGPSSEYEITTNTDHTADGNKVTLVVTYSTDQGKTAAINWIRQLGYDPNNYDITYKQQTLQNYHYTNSLPPESSSGGTTEGQ